MPPRSATTTSEKTYLLIASGLLLLYVFPYVWLGEGAYLTIHDNLDSDFLYLYLLRITDTAFDFNLNTVIPNMMSSGPHAATSFSGIPRSAFRTGLNLEVLSFYLTAPYTAQVINFMAVHGIGFLGMYLFLKKHVLPEPHWALVRVGVAFLFALVPCYIVHGASVTGQPLLLFAFLNLLNKQARWTDWLIIALFPFYSFFVWAGLFICVALGIIGLVAMLQHRQLHPEYLTGLLLLSLLYLISEWELIYGFVNQTYLSQRVEFDYSRFRPMSLSASVARSRELFAWPMFNTGTFRTRGILTVSEIAVLLALWKGDAKSVRWLSGLPLLAILICFIHGFYHYLVIWLDNSPLGLHFRVFQFDRFYFLLPLLWFFLFTQALRQFRANSVWIYLFLAGQFAIMIDANREWRVNVGKLTGHITEAQYPSFRAFFAEKQFAQIRRYIGRPQADYRVICLGMHPSVAQFNGFYTLDSYQNNYPLPYKHAFRKVIARELDRGTSKMRNYYDAYACRAYLYTAELGLNYLFGKTEHPHLRHLQINTDALKALGGEYIISAVPIDNSAENQLHLENIFTNSESYWNVWLYKVGETKDK